MNIELQRRYATWDSDMRAGVTGDWKIEQAIADSLLSVTWKRSEAIAWNSCLTGTNSFVYDAIVRSGDTTISFKFNAARNRVKREAHQEAYRVIERHLNTVMAATKG